jgi:hypothetical protein
LAGGRRETELRHLVRGVFGGQAKGGLLTLNLLRQHWPGVVGPELGARTRPQRLEGGTLTIAAPDACWAYELQFFKPELLASVQAFLESRTVSELRFQVRSPTAGAAEDPAREVPAPAAGPVAAPAAPGREPEPTQTQTPPALVRAAAAIGDPALRAVFQRSLAKQRRTRDQRESAAALAAAPHPAPEEP